MEREDGIKKKSKGMKATREEEREGLKGGERNIHGYNERIKCRDKEEKILQDTEAFSKAMLGPSVLWPGVQIAQSLPPPSFIICIVWL